MINFNYYSCILVLDYWMKNDFVHEIYHSNGNFTWVSKNFHQSSGWYKVRLLLIHISCSVQSNGFFFSSLFFDIEAFDDRHQHILFPTSHLTGLTHVVVGRIRDHVLTYTKKPIQNDEIDESATTTFRPTMLDFLSKIKKRSANDGGIDSMIKWGCHGRFPNGHQKYHHLPSTCQIYATNAKVTTARTISKHFRRLFGFYSN